MSQFQLHSNAKRWLFSFLLGMLALPVWSAEIPEYKLKAAYLYNFASFTEWPVEQEKINLCIFGDDPFGPHLKQVTARKIKHRTIAARTVRTVEGVKGCDLIFVTPSAVNRINQIDDQIADQPILVVADSPSALERGAMINMATRRGKVSFEVNLKKVKQHGLNISSKLLRLAKEVLR